MELRRIDFNIHVVHMQYKILCPFNFYLFIIISVTSEFFFQGECASLLFVYSLVIRKLNGLKVRNEARIC